jgi:ubiquinone/menaquinone biosynthesis C-methylase UbiE
MNTNKSVVWNPKLFKEHYEALTSNNIILSPLEQRKLEFYKNELALNSTDVVLDAGCGYGRFSKLICVEIEQIIGIDINPENISYAKEYVGKKFKGQVVDLSTGKLPFPDRTFNKIVIDNVLMFFPKDIQAALLKESKRVLKEEGVLAFNIENSDYILSPLSFLFFSLYRLKARLQGKVFPVHNKYPLSFYEKTLTELGFTRVASIGDTFYRKMGIGALQVFPKFLYSYVAKLDHKYFNTMRKKGMASFTVAASIKK